MLIILLNFHSNPKDSIPIYLWPLQSCFHLFLYLCLDLALLFIYLFFWCKLILYIRALLVLLNPSISVSYACVHDENFYHILHREYNVSPELEFRLTILSAAKHIFTHHIQFRIWFKPPAHKSSNKTSLKCMMDEILLWLTVEQKNKKQTKNKPNQKKKKSIIYTDE